MRVRITQDCECMSYAEGMIEPDNCTITQDTIIEADMIESCFNLFGELLDCVDITNTQVKYFGVPKECYECV